MSCCDQVGSHVLGMILPKNTPHPNRDVALNSHDPQPASAPERPRTRHGLLGGFLHAVLHLPGRSSPGSHRCSVLTRGLRRILSSGAKVWRSGVMGAAYPKGSAPLWAPKQAHAAFLMLPVLNAEPPPDSSNTHFPWPFPYCTAGLAHPGLGPRQTQTVS